MTSPVLHSVYKTCRGFRILELRSADGCCAFKFNTVNNKVNIENENTMSQQVHYAYHVTNRTEFEPRPNWPYLKTSPTIEMDVRYNGVLKNLTGKVMYFSTTLIGNNLPSKTLYPTYGKKGVKYWRAIVPLSQFNKYRIIHLESHPTDNGVDQVTLLLVPPEDLILNQKVNDAIKKGQVSEYYTGKVNEFLYRNEATKQWQSNSYMYNNLKAWVNIAVPHEVVLGVDTQWDIVEHM